MALTDNPREALLWALCDLEDYNFKVLKFHLRDKTLLKCPGLARGELEGLSRVDLASRLILMYGAHEAVKVVIKVLKVMNLLELVDQLSHICLNDYRETYREHVRCLEELQGEGVKHGYNQLLLVAKPSPGSSTLEQELTVEALFDPREWSDQGPPTVVIQGSAGTGKTTLARKMVLDWATGALYPGQFDYVFYVSCREVGLLPDSTLDQLLVWCCGDNKAPVAEIRRQQPERLLFILDGYDELQRSYAERLKRPGPTPIEDMLHRLIRREVLPTSSLLITTRPLALRNLESLLTHPRHVHILGFSDDERKKYFRSYFADEEQTRNAIDFVLGNDVLYKACQVPGICWVVCSWLKGQMERGGVVAETPSNSTDIFMAYVATFLPPNDEEGCAELTRRKVLKGLCSLAAEGIQHQRFLFEEAELRKHSLDGPSLAPFLSSIDYQEGLSIKKFYSFRHISFQEFFHAMSYLVKQDQAQLGEESLKEVNRLLDEKKQEGSEEMTLSMQFLLDISKKESSSNFELKFCFKISPLIRQDLKNFKEVMNSIKHKRTWDLEFSLYESKIKNLVNSVQMSDVELKIGHSNEKKSCSTNSFSVKTSLSNRQKEEQKCPIGDKGNRAGTQMEALMEKAEGQRTRDKDGRSSRMGSTEKGTLELKEGGGVEGQDSEGKAQ